MQNLSAAQLKHLKRGGRIGVTVTADLLDGGPLVLTEADIRSLTIDRNSVSGSVLEIGNSETSELSFELNNNTGAYSAVRWEGARLTAVLDIGGEPLQAGIFTVDEPPRKLKTMQMRALDDMAKFNRAYVPGIAYPATLEQILADACSQCNVTQHTLTFDNGSYVVDESPEGSDITFHHIVSWVAEIAGCNAWIDQLGRLNLSWYGDNQVGSLALGLGDLFSYEMDETNITVTGIVYYTEDTDYLIGTDDYALVVEDNPLLQANHETVMNSLYTKLAGFTYRPYTFSSRGYPYLWPGDIINELTDADGNVISSIITNHRYTINGRSELKAIGETETVRGYATGAPFTASQKRVLRSVAAVEVERKTSNFEQSMLDLNQLTANSLGYYPTSIISETGARVDYWHDQPALEESMNIWRFSEQGFTWTDSGWQGGSPVWQSGITAEGSIIAKTLSVIGIKAEWIDVDDLSAISGNFTSLRAGDINNYVELNAPGYDYGPIMDFHEKTIATAGGEIDRSARLSTLQFYLQENWTGDCTGETFCQAPLRTSLSYTGLDIYRLDTSELQFVISAYPVNKLVKFNAYGNRLEVEASASVVKGEVYQDMQEITAGTGWRKVAVVAHRSDFEIVLNTLGGSYGPGSLRIIGHTGWGRGGSDCDIVAIASARTYWSGVRITYDGANHLEVNFTTSIASNLQSRLMPFAGYKHDNLDMPMEQDTRLFSGALSAGSGEVVAQVTGLVRGINLSGRINAMGGIV